MNDKYRFVSEKLDISRRIKELWDRIPSKYANKIKQQIKEIDLLDKSITDSKYNIRMTKINQKTSNYKQYLKLQDTIHIAENEWSIKRYTGKLKKATIDLKKMVKASNLNKTKNVAKTAAIPMVVVLSLLALYKQIRKSKNDSNND
jgi:hypothetical protein